MVVLVRRGGVVMVMVVVIMVVSGTLALPRSPPYQLDSRDPGVMEAGGEEDGLFIRQTRKHARPMFYINCGYRDLCYCYSKMTRHHYCCSCDLGACFPASASVNTPSGTPIPMKDLRTGDSVLAVGDGGRIVRTTVLGFMDRRPRETALYLTFTTAAATNLTLSPNHVLFRDTNTSSSSSFSSSSFSASSSRPVSVFGSEINVGDVIFTANRTGLKRTKVVAIHHHVAKGAYVPLTKEGTMLVDNTLVSCYASYRHDLAHKFLAPVRFLPALLSLRPGLMERVPAWGISLATNIATYIFRGLFDEPEKNDTSFRIPHALSEGVTGQDRGLSSGSCMEWDTYIGKEHERKALDTDSDKNTKVQEAEERCVDVDTCDEGEGEAYYIKLVKLIGHLMYQGERVEPQVLQVRPMVVPEGGWGKVLRVTEKLLGADVELSNLASLLGPLARSW